MTKLGAVVLAAGESKRFGSGASKVLYPVAGRPVIGHVLATLRDLHRRSRLDGVTVVVSPRSPVPSAVDRGGYPFPVGFAVQRRPLGTGDAARAAMRALDHADEVMILAGDSPLISADSLARLVRGRRSARAPAALLTASFSDPPPYGRIIRSNGRIVGIVEASDATADELRIEEVSTCTYVFDRGALAAALPRLRTDNAQGEYYLPDAVRLLVAQGLDVVGVEGPPADALGVNTRRELADVVRILRDRTLDRLMSAGVTILDPATAYVDADVTVGRNSVLHPNTFLEGSTRVGKGCEIGPSARLIDTVVGDGAKVTFAVARGARIGPQAEVGPFASLRPGTVLRRKAKAGTFVETKAADIGEGAKVPHLSYMGDVKVGKGSNVGAGTITCNYDGRTKHRTTIGEDVFIGSDTILVAPVRVGRGAYTGAGSVVNRDVKAGELVYGVPARSRPRKRKSKPKKGE